LATTCETCSPDLLVHSAIDVEDPHHWCPVPYVIEGNGGELTAPPNGDANTEAEGQKLVATSLAAVEACVRQFPHAVNGVGTIRFSSRYVHSAMLLSALNLSA